jgi:hypothetical protein
MKWKLDASKSITFGFDSVVILVKCKTSITTRLKQNINIFLISIHCNTHRTNFTVLDTTKAHDCKEMFKHVDKFVNDVAMYFKKATLHALEKKLNDVQMSMPRYQKIR